jgi:4-hydroxybenzoate polyprenyltransferase
MSAVFAAGGMPAWGTLGWILVAMVGARSCAMAFNRLADAGFDADNPRTATRAIPAGLITSKAVAVFTLISAGLLVLAAWRLNRLALMLSPVALVTIMGYSYSKRFTSFAHVWLGLSLAIAPVGAWIAVLGRFDVLPLLLGLAVLLWVAGFDIIYACQDVDFDTGRRLHSIPARLGIGRSLILSAVLHVLMLGVLVAVPSLAVASGITLGIPYRLALIAVATLLTYEHAIVRPSDLSRVNAAFFTMNGVISLVLMAACVVDVLFW